VAVVKRRSAVLVVGQFFLDALAGRLGAPMMVLAYATFAVLLLAYVSTQVYTSSLMEDVAARKREELLLRERIGLLTARYSTMTSKSRVSRHCEENLGLVGATQDDVVRVAIDGPTIDGVAPLDRPVRVDQVLGTDVSTLSQVMRR
jgi:hypothetical protein